jgi:hypothetical protein
MRQAAFVALVVILVGQSARAEPSGLRQSLEVLRQVGPHGQGSREAAAAWKTAAAADPEQLPDLLAAMDGAGPLARNWLRSAVGQVLDTARSKHQSLPVKALEAFLLDRRHDPQARRLAYELLVEADAGAPERFLPGMLDDPSPDLRRDAVARALDRGDQLRKAGKKDEALACFRQAFAAARDRAQLDEAAKRLRDLGEPVDLATHLGMVTDWHVIGPFPDRDQKGLDEVYPPEQQIDLSAAYDGKGGKVRWKEYTTKDPYGMVDLNAAVGDEPASVGYAVAEFTAARARDVEVRVGCYNAFKLWVNGEPVLDRRDAFAGLSLDHYTGKVRLRAGKNVLLMKVCREDPPPPVAKWWRFQLRICDDNGAAILSTTRPPAADKGKGDRG